MGRAARISATAKSVVAQDKNPHSQLDGRRGIVRGSPRPSPASPVQRSRLNSDWRRDLPLPCGQFRLRAGLAIGLLIA